MLTQEQIDKYFTQEGEWQATDDEKAGKDYLIKPGFECWHKNDRLFEGLIVYEDREMVIFGDQQGFHVVSENDEFAFYKISRERVE